MPQLQYIRHLLDNNHNFDQTTDIKILHIAMKGQYLNNLEMLEIHKSN